MASISTDSKGLRRILFVGADPDDDNNRAIVHVKSNLAEKGEPVGYEIRDGSFYWKQKTDLNYDKINAVPEQSGAGNDACTFLTTMLASGEMLAKDLFKEAVEQGISTATLKRGKEKLGVIANRRGEVGVRGGGKWYWKLPEKAD